MSPPELPSQLSLRKGVFLGGKYEVYDVLGHGGFGVVYLVYSHVTKTAFAMKTFRDEFFRDASIKERFRREANLWIDLQRHPCIVQAYFVEEITGRLYVGMEYVAPDKEGLNSLDGYLARRPPDLAQSLRWAIQICYSDSDLPRDGTRVLEGGPLPPRH
jgi:serine/threonine protein kinase